MTFHQRICVFSVITAVTLSLVTLLTLMSFSVSAEDPTKYPILRPLSSSESYDNVSDIQWDSFKSCGGPMENCSEATPPPDGKSNTTLSPSTRTARPPSIRCQCDEQCFKYGDCCITVLQRLNKLPQDVHWRCVKLLNTNQAFRMISKCPSYYPEDLNKQLCETGRCPDSPKTSHFHASLCPQLDVPVLNNKTGDLYRSIFCARCHSVSNKDIHPIRRQLWCSNFTSRTEWDEFKKRSVYQQGELQWIDPKNTSVACKLHMQDLQPESIRKLVPDIRPCLLKIKEECPLDMSDEENRNIYNLCQAYMQVINIKEDPNDYKNPHCAKCVSPEIDVKNSTKCVRDGGRTSVNFASTRLLGSEKGSAPVGINILFHFSLEMDDGFVGYTSKCDDNEILDYIRHKCVPVVCQKGYDLLDGQCEKAQYTSSENGNNETYNSPPDNSSVLTTNSSEPCFLIILNAGEYRLLPNGSLVVYQTRKASEVLFQPGEYEQYNGSSMSICAEELEESSESKFAPALGYLSSALLALSVLFSVLHVILYMILPKMRNLPGNNLLCLTASLLISHFLFLTMISAKNRIMCVLASVTMHYFLLASFCWMNIMSFDIWRTFSSEFLVRRYSGDSMRTFCKYSLFAWITPMVIVALAVITDFALPETWLEAVPILKKLRPLYGLNNLCWINQPTSRTIFFAFPVAIIILCNLILFTLTATTILLQHREGDRFINGNNNGRKSKAGTPNGQVNGNGERRPPMPKGNSKVPLHGCNSGSTKKSDEIRLKLYAKLALIMGMTWILGFFSAFLQWEFLWYLFVIFNGLQGTFIFVAFDCKAKVWNMVKEQVGWKKKGRGESGDDDTKKRGTSTMSTALGSSTKSQVTSNGDVVQANPMSYPLSK